MSFDTSRLENFRYRPDVDGLRALAVIPVVFFHAALGFPGGFVGVDIFFVISGYLITTIISREIVQGKFQMKNFWERRIRRILPAAAVMTCFVLIAGAFILPFFQYETLGKSSAAHMLMVSNFYFWQQDGYFAAPSDFEPLLHTWSLAVEEQFYFILPLLLIFLYKRGSTGIIRWITILFLFSLAWSIYGTSHYPAATFYLLPSRAWELLLGSLIAIVPIRLPKQGIIPNILSWSGLALIIFSLSTYSLRTPFPGLAAIPPVLGAALLILANRDTLTLPAKVLSLPPLVFIGKISYSLYLWHWPLLVFAKHLSVHETPLHIRWSLVMGSFLMGYLSWRFIETPFRKGLILTNKKSIFKFFFITTAALTIIGTIIYKMEGLPKRFGEEAHSIAKTAEHNMLFDDTKELKKSGTFPFIGPPSESIPSILFWGDSHNRMMMPIIQDLSNERGVRVHYATRAGYPPILDTNRPPKRPHIAEYNDEVMHIIDSHDIKKIVLIARWTSYCVPSQGSTSFAITDREGSNRPPTEVFEEYLTKMIQKLHDKGIQVWIMRQVPYQKRSPVELMFHAQRLGRDYDSLGLSIEETQAFHSTVNNIFNRLPKDQVTLLDPSPYFALKNGKTRIHLNGLPIYFDEDHLSQRGARHLRPLLEQLFDELEKP